MDPNLLISISVVVGLVLLRILLPFIFDWAEPKPGKQRGYLQKLLAMIFTSLGIAILLLGVSAILCIFYGGWEALLKLLKS